MSLAQGCQTSRLWIHCIGTSGPSEVGRCSQGSGLPHNLELLGPNGHGDWQQEGKWSCHHGIRHAATVATLTQAQGTMMGAGATTAAAAACLQLDLACKELCGLALAQGTR